MTKTHCLALDLKNDLELIAKYKEYHTKVWPEILESVRVAGVENMEIFNVANRLFMIMTVNEQFDFEEKSKMDQSNPKVQEWESLMDTYQDRFPFANNGEKWVLLDKIFDLKQQCSLHSKAEA